MTISDEFYFVPKMYFVKVSFYLPSFSSSLYASLLSPSLLSFLPFFFFSFLFSFFTSFLPYVFPSFLPPSLTLLTPHLLLSPKNRVSHAPLHLWVALALW